jgi:hypothetical protein
MIAAETAYAALDRYPGNREKAAAYVHKQWIKRNRADPNQPQDLFKAYDELSEVEKDKDRAHIDQMQAALTAVRKAKKASAKNTKKQAEFAAAVSLQLDAKTAARLEAAAAALSAATGRKVTAQALLAAGAEAVLAICETAAPAKRKKKR